MDPGGVGHGRGHARRGPRRVLGGGHRRARRAGHLPLHPGVHRRHDHLGVDPALPQPRRGDGRPGGGRLRGRGRPRGARPAGSGAGVRGHPPDESLAAHKERGWRELGVIDEALLRGEIDEEGWHARMLDVIEPAYLAAETPQGQSGRSGDAVGWEHARRLLLDAVPDGSRRARRRLRQRAADGVAGGVGRRGRPHALAVRRGDLRPARRPRAAPGCRTGPTASGPATR